MPRYVTWHDHNRLTYSLYRNLSHRRFDRIIGIARSGLVLSVHLSHLMNVRKHGVAEVKRTDNDDVYAPKSEPRITYMANVGNLEGENVLLVDDIVGSGDSLRLVKSKLEDAGATVCTAVLYVNTKHFKGDDLDRLVDIYGEKTDDWIVFPWCKAS